MSTSLVSLKQSKSKDFIKTAYYPSFYQGKILVDCKDTRVMALDFFGKSNKFNPDEIYFTEDDKSYSTCTRYCEKKKIKMEELFKHHVQSITFMAREKQVVPVLSSIKIIERIAD